MSKVSDEDGAVHGKWSCDGCKKRYPIKRDPAEILHGQTSSGGFSLQFCFTCAESMKRNRQILLQEVRERKSNELSE